MKRGTSGSKPSSTRTYSGFRVDCTYPKFGGFYEPPHASRTSFSVCAIYSETTVREKDMVQDTLQASGSPQPRVNFSIDFLTKKQTNGPS